MPSKRAKQQKKGKNQHTGPKVPPTPISASDEYDKSTDKSSDGPDTKSAPASPYLTPPTSPSSPTIQPFSMDVLAHELQKLDIESSADDAATPGPEPDHAAANGSQEEQAGSGQQTRDEVHPVEHPTEREQDTPAKEQHLNSEPQSSHISENEETTESDEQTGEENMSGGEQSDQDGPQDKDTQQSHDETEQAEQASVEPSKPDDQTQEDQAQTPSEDLFGEPVPDAQDDHPEDDAGQGGSDDINAESQDSLEPDTQNGALPEDQDTVDSAPQSQEQEVQQLIDLSDQQEGVDQQQASEADDQTQHERDEDSGHDKQTEEAQESNAVQEPSGDLIHFDLENNNPQPEGHQDHIEEHAPVTIELHENGQDQTSGDDEALEHKKELGGGDQQVVDDHNPGPGDDQQSESEPEQVAVQDPQLDQQALIETGEQAGDEQDYAHENEQPDAEQGHVAEDDQQRENEQELDESIQELHDEPEHTPEVDQQLEHGEGTVEGGEQVEENQALFDTHEQLDRDPPSEDGGQVEDEQDVTGNDGGLDADQATLAASQQPDQQPDNPQEEADAADQELEYDSQEDTIGPLEDDLGAQSHEEYTGDQETHMEQERTEVEEHTLGDDPEDNKLDLYETDTNEQEEIHIVVQDFDDAFVDAEQDTAYEPELEDIQEETGDEMEDPREGAVLDISAKDVASRDLLIVADLFANMKSTLAMMSSAFERLGSQAEKMASIGLDAKAAEQLQRIKSNLEAQITRHKAEVEAMKSTLHAKVKEALETRIRDHLHDVIKGSVQNIIEDKVRQELSLQIPEDLRQQVISHKRQILEVKASLHNSEARRYNALQTFPTVNARLRPLLRPLPTPEQSPVPISISRSSSMGHSTLATPTTAFFQVPAPTPIKRTGSNSFRPTVPETVPPSPSPFFPRDMTTLFALNPEETKRLLREYGLSSAVASPAVEHPVRPRGLSIVNEDAAEEEDPEVHARDLNTFMAHIGVPYLMIPAPKEKHGQSAPLSSRSRRKLLTPLIIK